MSSNVDSKGRPIPLDAGHPRRTAEHERVILERAAEGDTRTEIERHLHEIGKPLSRSSVSRFLTRHARLERAKVDQAERDAAQGAPAPGNAMLAYTPAFVLDREDVLREWKTIAVALRGIVTGNAPASVQVRAGTELARLLREIEKLGEHIERQALKDEDADA